MGNTHLKNMDISVKKMYQVISREKFGWSRKGKKGGVTYILVWEVPVQTLLT